MMYVDGVEATVALFADQRLADVGQLMHSAWWATALLPNPAPAMTAA
jgi:hypothetical protein